MSLKCCYRERKLKLIIEGCSRAIDKAKTYLQLTNPKLLTER